MLTRSAFPFLHVVLPVEENLGLCDTRDHGGSSLFYSSYHIVLSSDLARNPLTILSPHYSPSTRVKYVFRLGRIPLKALLNNLIWSVPEAPLFTEQRTERRGSQRGDRDDSGNSEQRESSKLRARSRSGSACIAGVCKTVGTAKVTSEFALPNV